MFSVSTKYSLKMAAVFFVIVFAIGIMSIFISSVILVLLRVGLTLVMVYYAIQAISSGARDGMSSLFKPKLKEEPTEPVVEAVHQDEEGDVHHFDEPLDEEPMDDYDYSQDESFSEPNAVKVPAFLLKKNEPQPEDKPHSSRFVCDCE